MAGSLFVPPCGTPAVFTAPLFYRSAVFTAPRFFPLRGFFRSAVFFFFFFPLRGFYRSAFAGFLGALLFRRPHACCPPVFPHFRAARSLCRLAVRLRFLPLRGFYRSAFAGFLVALLFCRLHACCPPVFTHFRAARSLCRLAVRLRFSPLRGFYRSAFAGFFWGPCSSAALMLAAPQSSPTSGRTLWCRLVHSVSGGPPFLTLFLYRLVDRSRSVTAHLTGFPFVHFLHIRGPSIVSSFGCRDTGTTCTTTSLMGPFGYRKLGNLTYHRLL